MSAAEFGQYQVLIVGDPNCRSSGTPSANISAPVWAPVVMGSLGDRGVLTLGGAFGADRADGDFADQHRAERGLRLQLVAEGLDADLDLGLIALEQDDPLTGQLMLE